MKYIVFPTENLNEIPQEVLDELHLVPRKSTDGTQVIMKVVNYEKLFPSAITLPAPEEDEPQEVIYPYPTYQGDSLDTLLSGSQWIAPEEPILESPVLASLDTDSTNKATTRSKKTTKSTVL